MAVPRALPFEYMIRGAALEYLGGPAHAQAVEQRDAELEDFLAAMPRLVAIGSLQTPDPAIPAGTTGNITNPLTIPTTLGRWYRINLRVRALGASAYPATAQILLSVNTGVNTGDHWVWIGGPYTGINHHWLFAGTGSTHTFIGMLLTGAAIVSVATGSDGHFYIEDLGPVVAP